MLSKVRHIACCGALCGAAMSGGLSAATAQTMLANLDELEVQVVASLGAGIGEPGGPANPIDRRLRLAACSQPVTVEEPQMGAVSVRCAPQGWRIRVPLTAGSAPMARTAGAVGEPRTTASRRELVVRRGDQVMLVALANSFTVSTIGTAEQDGAVGDRIRVRTERRAAPFIGQVMADGRVSLPGFN